MKTKIILLCLFKIIFLRAQNESEILEALEKINSTEDSRKFNFENYEIKTFFYESVEEESTDEYVNSEIGKVVKFPDAYFKRIKNEKTESRVRYVYLNGKKLPKPKIDKLRKKIIRKYNSGKPFDKLAKKYSMDGNSENGGDLNWFEEGTMVSKFEKSVKEHQKGDLFTIDILFKDRKWYYVVLKTHDERIVKTGYTFIVVSEKETE